MAIATIQQIARSPRFLLATALVLYVLLTAGLSVTKVPICDEGWYGDPAQNLYRNGSMGSPVIESAGTKLKGIDRYTYWVMPLHTLIQAGWYRLFGPGLFSTRALSVAAGLLALLCWYVVVLRITDDKALALFVVFLTEIDAVFLSLAAIGRSDMLSAAFGAAAQASYLSLRPKHWKTAVFTAHSFVVASGLTHPNGGLIAFGCLAFLQLYYDRARLTLSTIGLVTLPYVAGGLAWAGYIMKAPDLFWAQFSGNSAERLWPLRSPLLALKRELLDRLLPVGMTTDAVGAGYRSVVDSARVALRSVVILAYLAGLLAVICTRRIRSSRFVFPLLSLTTVTFLVLLFFEGAKQPWYLLYVIWLLAACLVVSLRSYWQQYTRFRPVIALFVVGVIFIELGYPALQVKKDSYRHEYLPVVDLLSPRIVQPRSVMGTAALGFGLGFDKVIDDFHFGFYSRNRPEYIVFDPQYRMALDRFQRSKPDVYGYASNLLHGYHTIYTNDIYTVWERGTTAYAAVMKP